MAEVLCLSKMGGLEHADCWAMICSVALANPCSTVHVFWKLGKVPIHLRDSLEHRSCTEQGRSCEPDHTVAVLRRCGRIDGAATGIHC